MSESNVYPYGFIIAAREMENLPATYRSANILDRYYFYYDKNMSFNHYNESDHFLLIHGHYTYVNPHEKIENSLIAKKLLKNYVNDYEKFLDLLEYLAGRYVVIVGDFENTYFYQDAVGSRSVYYSLTEAIAASHVNLIAANHESEFDNLVKKYPNLPKVSVRTPYENIRSMLPNFKLDFHKRELKRFFPRAENPFKKKTDPEKVSLVDSMFKSQIDFYVGTFQNTVHSITGGIDSRASLAATKDYFDKIDYFTYTLSKSKVSKKSKFSRRYEEDKILVKQLIGYLPLKHSFLYIRDNDLKLTKELENNLDRNTVVKHGRYLIPHYLEYVDGNDNIHIRGNAGGVTKSTYIVENETRGIDFLLKKFLSNMGLKRTEASEEIINYLYEELTVLGYDQKLHGYEGLDLAYWEIRVGRFHTEIFNETDVAFDSLNLVNVRAIISIALSFDLDKRKNSYLMEELINKNVPILNFFGKNQLLNMYEQDKAHISSPPEPELILDEFHIFDTVNDSIFQKSAKSNQFYLPKKNFVAGNFSSVTFKFKQAGGFIELELFNNYYSEKGVGYMEYEIYKNSNLILSEDIALWKYNNRISIFNMVEDDVIEIRIVALKTVNADSWQKASLTKVNNYTEKSFNKPSAYEVLATSPYSKIHV